MQPRTIKTNEIIPGLGPKWPSPGDVGKFKITNPLRITELSRAESSSEH